MALTLTVGIPLPLAVVGHEGSTLLVAANGLRLLSGKPHPPTVPGPEQGRVGATSHGSHRGPVVVR